MNGKRITGFSALAMGAALTLTLAQPATKTSTAVSAPNFFNKNSHARENFSAKNSTLTPTSTPTWAEYPAAVTPLPYP